MKSDEPLSREEIALTIFAAMLPRAIDKADRKAFPEGSLMAMQLEISAAWAMADLWISERENSEPNTSEQTPPDSGTKNL